MIAGVSLPVIERTGGPTPSANPANEIARKLTGRDYISVSAHHRHGVRGRAAAIRGLVSRCGRYAFGPV